MTDYPQFGDVFTEEQLNTVLRSWLAFSATNLIFHFSENDDLRLLLGDRAKPAESIPEDGRWCLIGGFNSHNALAPCTSFANVANAHAKAMLGIDLNEAESTDFLPCEYPAEAMEKPLRTFVGNLPIKRVAFDRLVELTDEQVKDIQPDGKISAVRWVTETEFEDLAKVSGPEGMSFPWQFDHVRQGFKALNERSLLDFHIKVCWA